MKSVFVTLGALCIGAHAGLIPRQTWASCDGDIFPDPDDCKTLEAEQGITGTSNKSVAGNVEGACWSFRRNDNTLNCEIHLCYLQDRDFEVYYNEIASYAGIVGNICFPARAGGTTKDVSGVYSINVRNNPYYAAPSSAKEAEKRNDHELENETKRQEEEWFQLHNMYTNVGKPGARYKTGGQLPSGSSHLITKAETNTVTTGASFNFGGEFAEVFNAGVELKVEYSHSVTNTDGVSIVVQCGDGQSGQIYWVPKFNWYQGVFKPSGTPAEVWNPIDASARDYEVDCLG